MASDLPVKGQATAVKHILEPANRIPDKIFVDLVHNSFRIGFANAFEVFPDGLLVVDTIVQEMLSYPGLKVRGQTCRAVDPVQLEDRQSHRDSSPRCC